MISGHDDGGHENAIMIGCRDDSSIIINNDREEVNAGQKREKRNSQHFVRSVL
jgi:hypothetical protein